MPLMRMLECFFCDSTTVDLRESAMGGGLGRIRANIPFSSNSFLNPKNHRSRLRRVTAAHLNAGLALRSDQLENGLRSYFEHVFCNILVPETSG